MMIESASSTESAESVESASSVESVELAVGPYRYSALAAGPVDGDVVLLLHGFPETSYEWRAQLEALGAAGYRAVAPDQRGYAAGARPARLEEYAVERLVDDGFGFADALGAERFHLVGHDWGGFVVWYMGARDGASGRPRLRTLTVVSTPHPVPFRAAMHSGGDQRERSSYMEWFRSEGAEAGWLADDAALLTAAYADHPPDAREEYRRVFTADGGAALTGGLNWYRANGFDAPVGPITVPTLYVWSTDDVALGREAAEGTAAEVSGPYRFEVLDGVSHWIPEVAPDALNALLVEHLANS
jgi:pimeloyl-ACP methyl ester carboxylesterase